MYFFLRKKYKKITYLVPNKRKVIHRITSRKKAPKANYKKLVVFRKQITEKLEHSLKVFRRRKKVMLNFFKLAKLNNKLKTHKQCSVENNILNLSAKINKQVAAGEAKYLIKQVNKILKKKQRPIKRARRYRKLMVDKKKRSVH